MQLMNLNTKLLVILLFCVFPMLAQEGEEDLENDNFQYSPGNPESVFFDFEAFYPIALGDNVYSEAYTYDPGYALDFNFFIKRKITLGARISSYRGYVQDIEKTGNYSKTGFMLFGVHAGYYQPINREWSLHHKIGVGAMDYVNHAPQDKFYDSGTALFVASDVSYRLDKNFAVFGKIGFDHHIMNIQTTSALENRFNNTSFLSFGIGLRWHLQNNGG